MYLGQGKPVSSILFYGMIKFETSGVSGIKVDVMEVMLPGLRTLGEIGGPLHMSCQHGSLFFLLAMTPPLTLLTVWVTCCENGERRCCVVFLCTLGEGKMVPMLRLRMLIHSLLGPLPMVRLTKQVMMDMY